MELLKLLGIVIVIAGFALKLDSILVILVAAVVTALVGGLGPVTLLETLGSTFVANRSMAIFIIVMLVTGTLERNGLREAAAALIGKFLRPGHRHLWRDALDLCSLQRGLWRRGRFRAPRHHAHGRRCHCGTGL